MLDVDAALGRNGEKIKIPRDEGIRPVEHPVASNVAILESS
jgi:hypothetical protein